MDIDRKTTFGGIAGGVLSFYLASIFYNLLIPRPLFEGSLQDEQSARAFISIFVAPIAEEILKLVGVISGFYFFRINRWNGIFKVALITGLTFGIIESLLLVSLSPDYARTSTYYIGRFGVTPLMHAIACVLMTKVLTAPWKMKPFYPLGAMVIHGGYNYFCRFMV